MNNTYTAISIGPIYKTFSEVRKSRELWGASYLFSYITRQIIEQMKSKGLPILPFYPDDPSSEIDGLGAGFFSDRIIYQGDIKNEIEEIKNDIFNKLSTYSGTLTGNDQKLPEEYLKNYIRITVISFTLPVELQTGKNENNIVLVANKLLDSAELQEKYYQDITDINWRAGIDHLNGKIFYKQAFTSRQNFLFPSLLEIATDDFRKINKKDFQSLVKNNLNKKSNNSKEQNKQDSENQKKFINELKESFKQRLTFRPYHKYVAVVEADGDNIGATIAAIGSDADKIKKFSEALFNFSQKATKKISKYGGKPVYSGGDDLLFFAPIATMTLDKDGNVMPTLKSIFGLLKEIDEIFKKNVVENVNLKDLYQKDGSEIILVKEPTLSFGVSDSYYKFPLNESRDTAHHLLRDEAKKGDKNKVCFQLRKHSGQSFPVTVDKNKTESYKLFLKLMSEIPLDKELVTSIIFKLRINHLLLNQIANDKNRLYLFFNQEFDVDLTAPKNNKENFIKDVVDYYYQLAKDFPYDNIPLPEKETEADKSNIGKLYSTLRFMKHLIDENDE